MVELKSVKLKHVIDPDKRGFVITMAIPLIGTFKPTIRTRANFPATFGGAPNRGGPTPTTKSRMLDGTWILFAGGEGLEMILKKLPGKQMPMNL